PRLFLVSCAHGMRLPPACGSDPFDVPFSAEDRFGGPIAVPWLYSTVGTGKSRTGSLPDKYGGRRAVRQPAAANGAWPAVAVDWRGLRLNYSSKPMVPP